MKRIMANGVSLLDAKIHAGATPRAPHLLPASLAIDLIVEEAGTAP